MLESSAFEIPNGLAIGFNVYCSPCTIQMQSIGLMDANLLLVPLRTCSLDFLVRSGAILIEQESRWLGNLQGQRSPKMGQLLRRHC